MIKKIGVLGTGTMALGIVQILLEKNYKVIVWGRKEDSLVKFKNQLKDILFFKAKLSEEKVNVMIANLKLTNVLFELDNTDLIIESIVENLEVKKKILNKIDKLSQNIIIATNTSSLSLNKISEELINKENFLGIHFFNPVPKINFVEIIEGQFTKKSILVEVIELMKILEKEYVILKEYPGFIVNRILIPMINEAIEMLSQRVATVEEIDKAMVLGASFQIGPLALSDLIGNDVVLNIMESLYEQTKNIKYRPSLLLKEYVKNNYLGRKTKNGFYNYKKD